MLPAALLRQRHCAALDGQVVTLAAAAGEDDLVGAAVQHLGGAIPGTVERAPSATTDGVDARRIAPVLEPVRAHRLEHARIDRRGRGVVEIDRCRHLSLILDLSEWDLPHYSPSEVDQRHARTALARKRQASGADVHEVAVIGVERDPRRLQ